MTREWRSGEVMYSLVRHFVGWALPKQAPEQVRRRPLWPVLLRFLFLIFIRRTMPNADAACCLPIPIPPSAQPESRARMALDAAQDHLGCPQLLKPEALVSPTCDNLRYRRSAALVSLTSGAP